MPFILKQECPCCRDRLWHCERCWDMFHNGRKHNDYIPPKYFGQSMMSEKVEQKMKELGVYTEPRIKEDKNREYKEGE